MSEEMNSENTAEEQAVTEQPAAPTETEVEEHDRKQGNAEAAKYRVRLREVEAERDTLKEQVTIARKAVVKELLSGSGYNVDTLWKLGHDVNQFFEADGSLAVAASLMAHELAREEGLAGGSDGIISPTLMRSEFPPKSQRSFADSFRQA